jgi:hypothetical protein
MKLEPKLMVTNSRNYNIVNVVNADDNDDHHDDNKMDEIPTINYDMLLLNKTEEAKLLIHQHIIC